ADDHERQDHATQEGQRAMEDGGQLDDRLDRIDHEKVQADGRRDQAEFHVDRQDDAEPDRVEAGGFDHRHQDRRGHQDDRGGRQEAASHEQHDVDCQHDDPAIDLHRGDRLRDGLGDQQRGHHVAEKDRGADDQQQHPRFAQAVPDDRPQVGGLTDTVDDDHQREAERGAHAGGFRRRGDAAVERIDDPEDDHQERQYARHELQLLAQRVDAAGIDELRAPLPADEQGPQDEKADQEQTREYARDEQATDRGLRGDPVEDHRDARRDEDAERAA